MDVHASALFGERALAYSLLSYGAMSMHRRVPWFRLGGQMLHVLPLFLLAQLVVIAVRMAVGGPFPGIGYFLQSLSSTLLWPLFAVAVVLGVARAFAAPSLSALAPNLVPQAELPGAIAWNAIGWQVGAVLGPVVGGLAYDVSPPLPYLLAAMLLRR
jgi:hypothetical protein